MRKDMNKVLVERPRRGKDCNERAARRRDDLEGPMQLGMRAGYGYRWLNENLSPLRRYLRAQVGRPWNKVYGEIAAGIDRRNTVQQHVYQHIDDFIAIQVKLDGDRLVDLRRLHRGDAALMQELYVDPRSGVIRVNKAYRSWRRDYIKSKRARQAEIEACRRILDDRTQLHLLDGCWFRVEIAPLPGERCVELVKRGKRVRKLVADPCFDVVLKRMTSRLRYEDRDQCAKLYGSQGVYAKSKRQLASKEIRRYGLL
jgi:hypothetical protein